MAVAGDVLRKPALDRGNHRGQPYATLAALSATSDAVLAELDWDDLLEALSAHPRIGAAPTGQDRESAWSRQEQAGAGQATEAVRERLLQGNLAYEDRFGFGFLICATGRSAPEILNALEQRLAHDPLAEREVVRAELTAIVRLRLSKALAT